MEKKALSVRSAARLVCCRRAAAACRRPSLRPSGESLPPMEASCSEGCGKARSGPSCRRRRVRPPGWPRALLARPAADDPGRGRRLPAFRGRRARLRALVARVRLLASSTTIAFSCAALLGEYTGRCCPGGLSSSASERAATGLYTLGCVADQDRAVVVRTAAPN